MNIDIAQKLIQDLVQKGIHSFCLCPGGRLAPFVEVLSHSKGLEVISFFEERSAGFFALGRAQRDQKPIAVLTTSGTAVAELLPSVIEAYYSTQPLILITADRPLSFGEAGAPQTLKKALRILEDYCCMSKNISQLKDIDLSDWNRNQGSLHLNVCFDEPLIDKKPSSLDYTTLEENSKPLQSDLLSSADTFLKEQATDQKTGNLDSFFRLCKKPLILVAELRAEEQELVKELLKTWKGPFYTEALSNLEPLPQRLVSGESVLNYALKKKEIDGVIRLGAVPRVRFWRDLEKHQIPVLSLSSPPYYSGLSRSCFHQALSVGFKDLKTYLLSLKEFGSSLKDFDQSQLEKWKKILESYPQSESAWFWTLKKSLKKNSQIFLGNSSPIRLWDSVAFCQKDDLSIKGQGGVNGIDGLVSRFLGGCHPHKNNIGILGDLSLLYDMAGFWKSKELAPWTLVVINNFGGQIFSRLFKNPAFLNPHKLSFSPLADMWGLNYQTYMDSSDFQWPKKIYSLLEIIPKEEQTKACFQKSVSIWDSL